MTSRIDERTTTGDRAEQTFKHRARDALGLADLRFNGLQHASMLRGVEVRGSERIQERPARPRLFEGEVELDFELRRTRRRPKNTGDESCVARPLPSS